MLDENPRLRAWLDGAPEVPLDAAEPGHVFVLSSVPALGPRLS